MMKGHSLLKKKMHFVYLGKNGMKMQSVNNSTENKGVSAFVAFDVAFNAAARR